MSYDSDVSTIKAKAQEVKEKALECYMEFGSIVYENPWDTRERLGYVDGSYKRFYERDPKPLSSILTDLEGVKSLLEDPVTEKMDTVKGDVRDWQGDAAESFVESFLTPFPKTVTNQVEIVVELHAAIKASKEILDRARVDAVTVADNTIAALDKAMEIEAKNDKAMVLTIVGVVAAVAAAIPSMGTSVGAFALGMGIAGGVAAIESAKAGAKPITGTDPQTIMEQMDDALGELESAMTQEEDILAKVLQKDAQVIDENMRKILPKRPDIADNPDGGGFQLPTNPGS